LKFQIFPIVPHISHRTLSVRLIDGLRHFPCWASAPIIPANLLWAILSCWKYTKITKIRFQKICFQIFIIARQFYIYFKKFNSQKFYLQWYRVLVHWLLRSLQRIDAVFRVDSRFGQNFFLTKIFSTKKYFLRKMDFFGQKMNRIFCFSYFLILWLLKNFTFNKTVLEILVLRKCGIKKTLPGIWFISYVLPKKRRHW